MRSSLSARVGAIALAVSVASCGAAPPGGAPGEPSRPSRRPLSGPGPAAAPVPLDLWVLPLTLERALALAEERNPSLAALAREVEAARGRETQAGLYPNPSLFLETEDGPNYRGFGRTKNVVGVSVPLVLGGRLAAARAAAAKAREAAEADLELARRTLRAEVRTAFALALFAQERVVLQTELRELARESRDLASRRVRAGDIPEALELSAAVDLERAELERLTAGSELAGARLALAARLAVPAGRLPALAGGLPAIALDVALDPLVARVLAADPRTRAAAHRLGAARLEVEAARRQAFPDVELSVAGGRSPEVDVDGGAVLEVGVSVPLPLFDRNQGRIAEAEAAAGRAEREAEAIALELVTALRDAHRRHGLAGERARRLADEVLPRARLALDRTRLAFDAGAVPFLNVLEAASALGEVRALHLEARRDLAVARAELLRFTGE